MRKNNFKNASPLFRNTIELIAPIQISRKNAFFQEIEKLRTTASDPKCSAGDRMETENQIRVLQTTLLNQTVKQHNEQVIKDKKGNQFLSLLLF